MENNFTKKIGVAPGYLMPKENAELTNSHIQHYNYDINGLNLFQTDDVSLINQFDISKKNWININSFSNVKLLTALGNKYDIHPLILEDIYNHQHLPKYELYDDKLFFTCKEIKIGDNYTIVSEQKSFILDRTFLISLNESNHAIYAPVVDRLEKAFTKIRERPIDYLFYALLDIIFDHYFKITDFIASEIESFEDKLFEKADKEVFDQIQLLRKSVVGLRKIVSSSIEGLDALKKENNNLISKSTIPYLNDLSDHLSHILYNLDNQKEELFNLKELYLSQVNNQMNQVMKVLTIVATIFIPLTFLAGIYGMNFKYMPELEYKFSYAFIWLLFILLPVFMLRMFKKRGWL